MTPKQEEELLQRVRRTETRLTRFMEAQGFETQAQKPVWDGNALVVGTPNVGVKELLKAIPDHVTGNIAVVHDGIVLIVFERGRQH